MKLCGAMVKTHLFKQELSSSNFSFQQSFFSWMISLDELFIVCPYEEIIHGRRWVLTMLPMCNLVPFFGQIAKGRKKWLGQVSRVKK
jgi:hypothetical protein